MRKNGFSLVQTLIAVGVMGILLAAMTSMFQTQHREIQSLRQKQEVVELKNMMLEYLSKNPVCSWQLKDKTIDLSSPTTEENPSPTVIDLQELRFGPDPSSALLAKRNDRLPQTATGLRVAAISFRHIYATGNTDEYTGVFQVDIDESSTVRPIRSVQVRQTVSVNGADPVGAKRIVSCGPAVSVSTSGEEDLDSKTPFDVNCQYRWVTPNGYKPPQASFQAVLVTPTMLWWRERDYSSTRIYNTNKRVATGQYAGTITKLYRTCP